MRMTRSIAVLFTLFFMLTASAIPFRPGAEGLVLGFGSLEDMFLEADTGQGANNMKLIANSSTGKWQFQNAGGGLPKDLGSGSGSGGSGGVNILVDPSFEDGVTHWTCTGASISSQSYVNSLEGNLKFARIISTASGQYCETALITKPDNISGGCMMDFEYIQGDNAFDYKVFDSVGEISTGSLSDLIDWVKAPTQPLPCKSQMKLRVISKIAGTNTIDIDKSYLGSNKGFIPSVATSKTVSYSPVTQGFGTPTFAVSNYMISGDSIRIDINLNPSAAAASEARVNLPVGFTIDSSVSANTALSAYYRGYVGGSNGGAVIVSGGENYVKFSLSSVFGTTSTNPTTPALASQILSAGETLSFSVTIPVNASDTTSQEAYTPEQASFFVSVNIGGTSTVTGVVTTTPLELSSANLDMVLNFGSAKIPCNLTNSSTGLTCSSGLESLGAVFNIPVSGRYRVCSTFGLVDTGGFTGLRQVYTDNNSQSIIKTGDSIATIDVSKVSSRICDFFEFSSVGEKTIRLMYESTSGPIILTDRASNRYERDINITVELASNFASRPIIQNMVDTSFKSGLRVETCRVNNNGTVSFASNTCPSWMNTPLRIGVGNVNNNIKVGIFSSPPQCDITPVMTGAANIVCAPLSLGLTAFFVDSLCELNTNSSSTDSDYSITCRGER